MTIVPKVAVEVGLRLDDAEAEVLHLLTSYNLAEFFAGKCNNRMTPQQIRAVLDRIHQETAKVVELRDAAVAVFEKDYLRPAPRGVSGE